MNPEEISMWKKLFGTEKLDLIVQDVIEILKDSNVAKWKRLPLALIFLVDGVLICSTKNLVITYEYVEMLSDIDYFIEYPWGRESFKNTMFRFGPPLPFPQISDPIEELKIQLKQQTSACYGFPLPLQLMTLEAKSHCFSSRFQTQRMCMIFCKIPLDVKQQLLFSILNRFLKLKPILM